MEMFTPQVRRPKMSLSTKHNIEDPKLRAVINDIEKETETGKGGNFKIESKGITKKDNSKLKEGIRYIDTKNKRIVIKIKGKLYGFNGTEI